VIATRPLYLLFIVFILVQVILYFRTGVVTSLEAEKYIQEGNNLYDFGGFSASKYIFYLPVILLVWFCRLTGLPYEFVVIVQVALSWIALRCFYKLGKNISGENVAFWSSLLLALFIPLQIWNFFLYTDSVFISLTIIYVYIIFINHNKNTRGTFWILLFLLILIFSRPHGFLFIPPTIIYLLFRKQSRSQLSIHILISALMIGGMYFLLNAAFSGGGDMDAMKPFIEEHIICFVPMKPEGAAIDIVKTSNPVSDLFYYITHNPFHFLRLMGLKLLSFFNLTRPYYSTSHNLMLSLIIIPVYFFSIIGMIRFPKGFRNFVIFLAALMILFPLGATFQCDDWHSRFTMIVFPYFILLAVIGFFALIKKRSAES